MNAGKFRTFAEYLWLYKDTMHTGRYNSFAVGLFIGVVSDAPNHYLEDESGHFSIYLDSSYSTYWRIHDLMESEVSE